MDIVQEFHRWMNKQEAGYFISVNGNHELKIESNFSKAKEIAEKECPGVHFIGDGQTINIEGIKIFGSAVTPYFYNWAWNYGRTIEEAAWRRIPFIGDEWAKIEPGTNIVITHGMPYGILDTVYYANGDPKENVGCMELLKKIKEIKPDIVIGGHLHGNGNKEHHEDGTSFYNVAVCDDMYTPSNGIRIIEYEKE